MLIKCAGVMDVKDCVRTLMPEIVTKRRHLLYIHLKEMPRERPYERECIILPCTWHHDREGCRLTNHRLLTKQHRSLERSGLMQKLRRLWNSCCFIQLETVGQPTSKMVFGVVLGNSCRSEPKIVCVELVRILVKRKVLGLCKV